MFYAKINKKIFAQVDANAPNIINLVNTKNFTAQLAYLSISNKTA